MKKGSILIISLWLLLGVPAQAVRFGLKTGINLSEASITGDALKIGNLNGFQVGPMMEFRLPIIGLDLNAAILYSQQGFKFNNDQTQRMNSMVVPVNIKYRIDLLEIFNLYASVGPYADFKLSGDTFFISGIKEEFEQKNFGAGLNFGFGVELFKHLQVGTNYQLKLTDDYSAGTYSIQTKTWSATVAYFF